MKKSYEIFFAKSILNDKGVPREWYGILVFSFWITSYHFATPQNFTVSLIEVPVAAPAVAVKYTKAVSPTVSKRGKHFPRNLKSNCADQQEFANYCHLVHFTTTKETSR